ncbi:unnamed protein product [Anisakis simplex]|uniref:BCNT-C domain-containing protein n=1 Tax=Anisakis simplex TaxID=6269 RepID=A0A0M3J5S2_ANISI|nr:unnamed protein product [Anisakis simplex]
MPKMETVAQTGGQNASQTGGNEAADGDAQFLAAAERREYCEMKPAEAQQQLGDVPSECMDSEVINALRNEGRDAEEVEEIMREDESRDDEAKQEQGSGRSRRRKWDFLAARKGEVGSSMVGAGPSDALQRRDERRRWRQMIDGFAQYAEWEAKVLEKEESRSGRDLEGGGAERSDSESDAVSSSGASTVGGGAEDPESEYFLRTDLFSFPYKEFLNKVKTELKDDERQREADKKMAFVEKQMAERRQRLERETGANRTAGAEPSSKVV